MERYHGRASRGKVGRRLACAVLAVVLTACAAPYDPFRIPIAELRSRVRTIAVAPLLAAPDVVDVARAGATIEPLLADRIAAAGFAVVPSDVMERAWRRAAEDVGGVFDPVTGAADPERFEAVQAAVFRDLRTRHHVDAVLHATIAVVALPLTGGTVSYCGRRSDAIYWPSSAAGGLRTEPTLVTVLCLNAWLYDMEQRELYGIRHGIEPVGTYLRQTRAVRPIAERLGDRARLTTAVDEVLGPLGRAEQ